MKNHNDKLKHSLTKHTLKIGTVDPRNRRVFKNIKDQQRNEETKSMLDLEYGKF